MSSGRRGRKTSRVSRDLYLVTWNLLYLDRGSILAGRNSRFIRRLELRRLPGNLTSEQLNTWQHPFFGDICGGRDSRETVQHRVEGVRVRKYGSNQGPFAFRVESVAEDGVKTLEMDHAPGQGLQ